jgi:hypothetical protein
MPRINGNNAESKSTQELEFQELVKGQFELMFARMDKLDGEIGSVRSEMIERFLQLSRQVKDLDIKVDVYTREHSYMKDDIREMRAKMNLQ